MARPSKIEWKDNAMQSNNDLLKKENLQLVISQNKLHRRRNLEMTISISSMIASVYRIECLEMSQTKAISIPHYKWQNRANFS